MAHVASTLEVPLGAGGGSHACIDKEGVRAGHSQKQSGMAHRVADCAKRPEMASYAENASAGGVPAMPI